jgi:hypothetical protein
MTKIITKKLKKFNIEDEIKKKKNKKKNSGK